ncbi:MAG: sulfide/dihydroorotate dehydrogenase-like FAD/NAD-binding protein [Candidatus Ranarchaeia archaeon]|jgi:ferredoxin--NADP+ reductase
MASRILLKEEIAPGNFLMAVEAPLIAKKAKPGQFIILRLHERSERLPLTIAWTEPKKGTVTIIFKAFGKSTLELGAVNQGDSILDFAGPCGHPSPDQKYGTAVCIGGGSGLAVLYPRVAQLQRSGNRVITIIGARTADQLILEKRFRKSSSTLHITTDDGTKGVHGFVTQVLTKLLSDGIVVDYVFAVGPVPMMNAVVKITKPHNIPTDVSLNPLMVDGTGMCGGCRAKVNGKTQFACVDGPEFNGFNVDFDELSARNKTYEEEEARSLELYLKNQAEVS